MADLEIQGHRMEVVELPFEGIHIICECNWSPDFVYDKSYTLDDLVLQYKEHLP